MKFKYLAYAILLASSVNGYTTDFETEPNNSKEEADPLFFNVPMVHYDAGDHDWFYFDITENNILNITLNNGCCGGPKFILYDSDENILFSDDISGTTQIGLAQAGRYFLRITNPSLGGKFTISLENRAPHSDSITNCTSHAKYSSNTGLLEIPAVDVTDAFGNMATFKVDLQYSPLGENLMFEVKNVE